MKLHYSQTLCFLWICTQWFDYHMKLHYSQTKNQDDLILQMFDYHMKLHYSQTDYVNATEIAAV